MTCNVSFSVKLSRKVAAFRVSVLLIVETKMKFLLLVVLSATLLLATEGSKPEGENVKTSVKQLNWLEKMLIRKFHPKMNLNRMSALEVKRDGENTIQDDYVGYLEGFHVEVPLLLLQLVKLGDDILIPTYHHEFQWWWCLWGICDGWIDIYDIRSARLTSATKTNLHASMNGTKFRVEFEVPDLEIQCPECTYDYTDYGEDPPATSDSVFWRGYSLFIKNYSMVMTGDFGWNFNKIDVMNLELTLEVDELWDRRWNATHTFPDGTQEEWGSQDNPMHEKMMDDWNNGEKEEVEEKLTYWLNCYLSNGRNNKGECGQFFDQSFHNITAAEILHLYGLAALNNHRETQQDTSGAVNLNADDPIETMNSIIFEYASGVMQAGKYAAAVYETEVFPLQRAFTLILNKEICSENSTGNAACETFQEQTTIGAPLNSDYEYSTTLHGARNNRASLTFDVDTVSYSFHIPDMILTSTDYQRILTNIKTGDQQVFSGLNLNVFNCSLGFVADYSFEDDHFVISMKKIELFMDKVTMDIPEVSASENGEWVDLPSIHKDAAPMVMELWEGKDQDGVSLEERYRAFLEEKINDFLAGKIAI